MRGNHVGFRLENKKNLEKLFSSLIKLLNSTTKKKLLSNYLTLNEFVIIT